MTFCLLVEHVETPVGTYLVKLTFQTIIAPVYFFDLSRVDLDSWWRSFNEEWKIPGYHQQCQDNITNNAGISPKNAKRYHWPMIRMFARDKHLMTSSSGAWWPQRTINRRLVTLETNRQTQVQASQLNCNWQIIEPVFGTGRISCC